jgi:hypothetical protein
MARLPSRTLWPRREEEVSVASVLAFLCLRPSSFQLWELLWTEAAQLSWGQDAIFQKQDTYLGRQWVSLGLAWHSNPPLPRREGDLPRACSLALISVCLGWKGDKSVPFSKQRGTLLAWIHWPTKITLLKLLCTEPWWLGGYSTQEATVNTPVKPTGVKL